MSYPLGLYDYTFMIAFHCGNISDVVHWIFNWGLLENLITSGELPFVGGLIVLDIRIHRKVLKSRN
jgi:hypothetical protein